MRDNFKQLCKPLNFEDAINKGQLYRIAFSKENIDKLKLILTKLNKTVKELNLKPTWKCKCGWKSTWYINKNKLTLNQYIPLLVTDMTSKNIKWYCPNCKKINRIV